MKAITALSAVLILLAAGTAHAGDSHTTLPEASEKPGSMLYGLDRAQESISLALTFDQEKKAEKRLKYAEERLAEANELVERNRSEDAEKAVEIYSRQMSDLNSSLENLPDDKREEVKKKIENSEQEHAAVLKKVLERTPDAANKGLKNAIERSPVNPMPGHEEDEEVGDNQGSGTGYTATGRAVPLE